LETISIYALLKNVKDAEEAVRAELRGWNDCSMYRIEEYLLEYDSLKFVKYRDDIVVALTMKNLQ
jgi:hypothetical protein